MTNVASINEGPLLIIPEDRVTLHELKCALDSLFMGSEFRDGTLFIVEGIDVVCSVNLETDWKNIRTLSVFEHRGPRSKVMEKINELNGEVIFARFRCVGDESISADFFSSYEGGLNVRQFVIQLRRFAETVAAIGGIIFSTPLR